MENEPATKRYELPSYGIALLKHLHLPVTISQKDYLKKHWHGVYQNHGNNVFDTVIYFYSDIFPQMESAARRIEFDDFSRRKDFILERIKVAEARENYQSGELDKILIEQERKF